MRYLDTVQIESPNHNHIRCMAPDCEETTPYNEMWSVSLTYRELDNYWRTQTNIALCCSQECCEALAKRFGASDTSGAATTIKVLDHDAESARMLADLRALLGQK